MYSWQHFHSLIISSLLELSFQGLCLSAQTNWIRVWLTGCEQHTWLSGIEKSSFIISYITQNINKICWLIRCWYNSSSVQFSHSVVSNCLRPHGLKHSRTPCPSPTPGVHPNSCPLSWWCHPTISSSVVPFSSRLQSFPTSGSFHMSQLFASGGQSIGASTFVLPMNTQDWSPLRWTVWISLQSKKLSRVFSNTTVQKYQFFGVQPFLWSNSHICIWHIDLTRQTSVSEVMSLFLICCLG